MVQIIAGEKGKGKTKILLDKVNSDLLNAKGSLVYLDKNTKHMYELNKKVRLINVKDFLISNSNEFIGFMAGIISQDHDLEKVYLDSFMNLAGIEDQIDALAPIIEKIDMLSAKFGVDFVISISVDSKVLPEALKDKVIAAL